MWQILKWKYVHNKITLIRDPLSVDSKFNDRTGFFGIILFFLAHSLVQHDATLKCFISHWIIFYWINSLSHFSAISCQILIKHCHLPTVNQHVCTEQHSLCYWCSPSSKIALKGTSTAKRYLLSALNYVNSVVGLHLYFVYDTLFNSEKMNANGLSKQDDACMKNRKIEMLIQVRDSYHDRKIW